MHITIPYEPMPHQLQLHSCQSSLVAVCGRQIGKTIACVNELIKRAIANPGTRNWYVTNDYKQAKRNVWDLFKFYIPSELKAKFNEQELLIRFPNGSRIELIGVERAQTLRGAVVHFFIFDEYADFPRGIYEEVFKPMGSTTAAQAWFIGTPKGLGNDMYDKFTLPDPKRVKFTFQSCEIRGDKVVSVLSSYAKIEELQHALDTAIRTGTMDVFEQEYLGKFTRPSGTVYKEWDIAHFLPITYDPTLPLHITFDFGVNDPTAVIWIQPRGSETRIIDYYEASDANIEHFVAVINAKSYKPADMFTGDVAGNARELTSGLSPIAILGNKGMPVRTTHIPSVEAQIRATHAKIPGLFIDSERAGRFRDAILNYRYPEKKQGVLNQTNELPIHDEWSHPMRAFEYWVCNYAGLEKSKELLNKRRMPQRGTGDYLERLLEREERTKRAINSWT